MDDQFVRSAGYRLKRHLGRIDMRRRKRVPNLTQRRLLLEPHGHERSACEVDSKIEAAKLHGNRAHHQQKNRDADEELLRVQPVYFRIPE